MVRIAVVEDEAVSRTLLRDYLTRYGEERALHIDATYFTDGAAIIGDYKPVYDIILMDIQMAHVDGMSAARAIREVDQEVILVFITSAPQFAINGYEVGALSYLLKPLP
ncbi:MAG: LytR/AlgR family response regulator transcription factor, partial [Pauljensenia sp.]